MSCVCLYPMYGLHTRCLWIIISEVPKHVALHLPLFSFLQCLFSLPGAAPYPAGFEFCLQWTVTFVFILLYVEITCLILL